jgi:ABC-type Fe3+ transport system substrate-binding protein
MTSMVGTGGRFAAALAAYCGLLAATHAAPSEALLQKAAEEGEVAIFVSTDSGRAEAALAIAAGIERDLHIQLKIRLVSGPPDPIYIKQLSRELKAGVAPTSDMVVMVPDIIAAMHQDNALETVDWSKLAIPAADITPALSAVYMAELARPLMYNVNSLKAGTLPKSIEEFTTAAWRGKLLAANLPDIFAPWAIGLGETATVDLTRQLLANGLVLAPYPAAIRTQVASGQYPAGLGIRISKEQIAAGAPVAYIPIKTPIVPRLAVLIKGAKHPAAAQVAIWWLSSTSAGRAAAASALDWPRHTTPGSDLYTLAKTSGVYTAPVSWWLDEYPHILRAVDAVLKAR